MNAVTAIDPLTQRARRIASHIKKCAESIIAIGSELIAAKRDLAAQGRTLEEWLSEAGNGHFDMSLRTAYNYMAVADKFGHLNFESLDIAPSALYAMTSYSEPVIDRLLAEAAQGKRITYTYAKAVAQTEEEKQSVEAPPPSDAEPVEITRPEALEPDPPLVFYSQNSDEHYTPDWVLEAARKALGGIELDPASSYLANQRVQADRFFSLDDDGLTLDWVCRSLWLNPPYSRVADFTDKLIREWQLGSIDHAALLLVKADTSTQWFAQLWEYATAICFVNRRIKFEGNNQSAPFASAIAIFAHEDSYPSVREALSPCGAIARLER